MNANHEMPKWKVWVLALRPPTLGASLIPVLVGLALASRTVELQPVVAAATAFCALLLQITTNLANDYFDFVSGIDTEERLGPVRVTQSGLLTPDEVKTGLKVVLAAAVLLGAYLVWAGGAVILGIGLAAIVFALAYSAGPFPLASYGMGEVLVFVFFGFAAVVGTHHLQGAAPEPALAWCSLAVASLAAAIIVVNNLRDIPTDTKAGKRTVATMLGESGTRAEYTMLIAAAYASLIPLALYTTPWACLAALSLPLALSELRAIATRTGRELNGSLVGTARLHLVFGALLTAGLLL